MRMLEKSHFERIIRLVENGLKAVTRFRMLLLRNVSEMCTVGWPLAEKLGLPGGVAVVFVDFR